MHRWWLCSAWQHPVSAAPHDCVTWCSTTSHAASRFHASNRLLSSPSCPPSSTTSRNLSISAFSQGETTYRLILCATPWLQTPDTSQPLNGTHSRNEHLLSRHHLIRQQTAMHRALKETISLMISRYSSFPRHGTANMMVVEDGDRNRC